LQAVILRKETLMCYSRLGLAVLLLLPVLLLAQPAAAKRKPTGTIRGHLAGRTSTKGLQFLIDGVKKSARIKKGDFTLTGVPAGRHVLSVIDGRKNAGAFRKVRVRQESTTKVGTLKLRPGGQIAGLVSRVIDIAANELEPLQGVEVVARFVDDGSGGGSEGSPPLTSITDESGAYAFKGAPPGSYEISVVVPGLEAGVNWAWVEVGRTAVADFQLREAIEDGVGTVSGTVTDADQNPIEGALVTLTSEGVYYPVRARDPRGRDISPATLPRGSFSTLTNEKGHYTLHVPTGYLSFSVWAEGYAAVWEVLAVHKHEHLEKDVILQPEEEAGVGNVEGTVVDAESGEGIAGATVTIFAGRGGSLFVGTTDENGHYRFEDVPAGEWKSGVDADGYDSVAEKVVVFEGDTIIHDYALTASG
jgi:hypothetical protein